MHLGHLFHKSSPTQEMLPKFVRALEDIHGIRILRLQGEVGKEIGGAIARTNEEMQDQPEAFTRPLLLDFAGTTGCDFATVAFLVDAVRRRMANHAQVGIVNAPPQLIAEIQIARLDGMFLVFHSENEAFSVLGTTTTNQ